MEDATAYADSFEEEKANVLEFCGDLQTERSIFFYHQSSSMQGQRAFFLRPPMRADRPQCLTKYQRNARGDAASSRQNGVSGELQTTRQKMRVADCVHQAAPGKLPAATCVCVCEASCLPQANCRKHSVCNRLPAAVLQQARFLQPPTPAAAPCSKSSETASCSKPLLHPASSLLQT